LNVVEFIVFYHVFSDSERLFLTPENNKIYDDDYRSTKRNQE